MTILKKLIFIKKIDQPPKNNITNSVDIKIILLYSAIKKKAKPVAEYSIL